MTVAERSFCVNALDLFEGFLLSSSRGNFSFEAISTLLHGLLLPRTPLRPARIYYTVEPSYIVTTRRRQLELSDLDNLDYMELSVVSIDKEIQMPAGDVRNPWSSLSICKASLQLHFSTPMLFSYGMWRRLERHLARPAAVKENVNLYRYMSGFKFEEPELVMRTCLPEAHLQHWYTVNTTSLLDEKDCVISDICIGNGADLAEVVSIVRAQAIHNSLWESLLAMSTGKWKKGLAHVDIRIFPSPARFELSLCAESKMYLIRIELTREFEWIGTVEDSDGEKVNVELDSLLTTRIN
ncbi:hypothetical protein NECAME_14964, partial [Necator americanus]